MFSLEYIDEQIDTIEKACLARQGNLGLLRWWMKVKEQTVRGLYTDEWLQQFTTGYIVLYKRGKGGVSKAEMEPIFDKLGIALILPKTVISGL